MSWQKGRKQSEEHKEKIRLGNLGKPKPKPEGFKNSGTFGNLCVEKHREIAKKARSKSKGFFGKKHTEESNQKNRDKHLGISHRGWKRLGDANKKQSETRIKKFKDGTLKVWNKGKSPTEKALKNWLKSCGTKPNKKEIILDNFLKSILPIEYQINVKADVMTLGGKIPDFVNINGKKKLIELYGDFWHRNDNPQDRIDYFKNFGWDTLVIWEKELKDRESLKEKILNFNEREV